MKYGINLLLWTDTLDEPSLVILDKMKAIGYDAVELPLFDPDLKMSGQWGKRLDELGLDRTAVTIRSVEDNPASADPSVRKKAIDATCKALDCAAAAGCTALCGPLHSALGYFSGAAPTKEEWQHSVDTIRTIAEYADTLGIDLALEAVNRFECYLINSAADLARFCRDVDHPRARAMYDTFHSHIEEKDPAAALHQVKDYLVHFHVSENDRSTPGSGNIRWPETFKAVHEIGYDRLMVVEAFGLALDKIVAATKIWRRMYESEEQLATDALKFMTTSYEAAKK